METFIHLLNYCDIVLFTLIVRLGHILNVAILYFTQWLNQHEISDIYLGKLNINI
ncbi:hypothetical protein RhiirA4_457011 [Rhizophagus irregularis]|uniref:Uncharacterized protein n=1 Tax=Rhizophagus irregularis TaxID=588596 RepID=A0A2I1G8X1_9GLOM|nr:hypothetical protein RhiirA4_457011 [Rhizophagus irregularis]